MRNQRIEPQAGLSEVFERLVDQVLVIAGAEELQFLGVQAEKIHTDRPVYGAEHNDSTPRTHTSEPQVKGRLASGRKNRDIHAAPLIETAHSLDDVWG